MSLWRRAVPSVALLLCIACQTIESSALWNTSMFNLQDTLEGMEVTTEGAMAVQVRRTLCSESRNEHDKVKSAVKQKSIPWAGLRKFLLERNAVVIPTVHRDRHIY